MLGEGVVTVSRLGQKREYTLHPALNHFWEHSQDFTFTLRPALSLNHDKDKSVLAWQHGLKNTIAMLKERKAILLDIRPSDEQTTASGLPDFILRQAINPLRSLTHKLPNNRPILVLCRGRLCGQSWLGTKQLRSKGFQAYRVEWSWQQLRPHIGKETT